MPPEAAPSLTKRQQAVMERIDRRMSIKVIARELGVSETRINQHIRALKDIFSAESLGDLVEEYRKAFPSTDDSVESSMPVAEGETPPQTRPQAEPTSRKRKEEPFSEPVYSKNQVPVSASTAHDGFRVDQGELVMSDVLPLIEQAPWLRPGEPKVVPGVLDGEHAVLFRLAAILGIAFGILAAVVLTVTAAVALSDAMDGKAAIPVEEIQPAA